MTGPRALRRLVPTLVLLASACGESQIHVEGGGAVDPVAIRLVDVLRPEAILGRVPVESVARTEWRFDAAPPPFESGPGIAELSVREGRLVGRTRDALPILRIDAPDRDDRGDFVHAVEVRLRVSAGQNLRIDFHGPERPGFAEIADRPRELWSASTPIVPGTELRTYTLRGLAPIPATALRHAFLAPTDAADARFEIESIRIVFEREHLAGIASGVAWQGLSEVYRETLVARAPESVRLPLAIPERAWLDVGLGTLEDAPLTFRVHALGPDGEMPLLERTVTTPRRWERAAVDLSPLSGRSVTLSLSLAADRPGTLGFWGSPVVRTRAGTRAARLQGVILVQADTLRSDHLDVYGYARETAPTLRRLAAEGALFGRCVAQGTWTKVSSPSILLSLYPSSHGIANFGDRLPESATTLAEAFRSAGFATLSLSSVFFTGKLTNLQQGFEELHESTSVTDLESSKTAREYVDRLVPWLELHREDPFFVYLHLFDPHDPYRPARPYDALFGDVAGKTEHERQAREVRRFIANPLLRAFGMPSREELTRAGFDPDAYVAHDVDWYDGSIRAMDVELRRVVETLRGLGLAERTLVAFTSDHGEEFLEHDRMFHGQSVYGALSRVPLVLWAPGHVPAGTAVDDVVQSIDIAPTLLELAGLPPLPRAQGRSLVALIEARSTHGQPPAGWPRPAITEKLPEKDAASPTALGGVATAIVVDGWKLVHHTRRPTGSPEFELYDDERDPLNREDLAARHPDVVAQLTRQLEAWRAATAPVRLAPEAEAGGSMSAEELERLRSLGYLQ